jgi:hypothetical protein
MRYRSSVGILVVPLIVLAWKMSDHVPGRLRGLEIYDQLEFRGLYDRQFAGLFALENATRVKSDLSPIRYQARSQRVKSGKAHSEQMLSACPPQADIDQRDEHVRLLPVVEQVQQTNRANAAIRSPRRRARAACQEFGGRAGKRTSISVVDL